jgi:hypothetical protein
LSTPAEVKGADAGSDDGPAALNRRPEAVEDRTREAMIERVWVCSMGDLAVGNDRDRAGYRS